LNQLGVGVVRGERLAAILGLLKHLWKPC
jgi:hypothetical protein